MLFFNKQFRTEEKIISELVKKIKKSETIKLSYSKNSEIYKLDTLDISLDAVKKEFVVTDKSGNKIISMDCHIDLYDEMQKVRFNWFDELLNAARVRMSKQEKDLDKQKKLQKAKSAFIANMKAKERKKQQQEESLNALQKIQEL